MVKPTPLILLKPLARGASRLGVRIEENCRVTKLLLEKGKAVGVELAEGQRVNSEPRGLGGWDVVARLWYQNMKSRYRCTRPSTSML